MSTHAHPARVAALILTAALLGACNHTRSSLFAPRSAHEGYLNGLRAAGLDGTALGTRWQQAAEEALQNGPMVNTPFEETAYFPVHDPLALGYTVQPRRGERVHVAARVEAAEKVRVFLDVFEQPAGTVEWKRLASADSVLELDWVAERDRTYRIRVQPELLRSARITLTIHVGASLAFPVQGRTAKDIRSFHGDARDGGARRHEGVDIFAPRGTPVVAVSDGFATASTTRLGGKVVWLRGKAGHTCYYAHLDSQYVKVMRPVRSGDTLGLVGNTGNAEHTPPHLHFGIYASGEGAIDPLPFLNEPSSTPPTLTADTSFFTVLARVKSARSRLYSSPDVKATVIAGPAQHAPVQLMGATGGWYHVRLGDVSGYIAAKEVERASSALETMMLRNGSDLRDRPSLDAPVIMELAAGERIEVLARTAAFLHVRAGTVVGWLLSP